MTEAELDILAGKIAGKINFSPRWLKLSAAAKYSSINAKRLKLLAESGHIVGYQDPDTTRGDWIFDRESIDQYRLLPIKKDRGQLLEIVDEIERFL